MLQQLDNEICSTIQNEDELEANIIESAAIQEAIQDKLTEIKAILNPPTVTTTYPLNIAATEFVSTSDHHTLPSRRKQATSRLPKLSFSGDPLTWQSFWDSFDAVVNSNTALDGIQKFHYLRVQLHRDAAWAIAGLPLSNPNYEHAIALLTDRFGQPNKIADAHKQAFLDIPKPNSSLSSLRHFHDSVDSHIKELTALDEHKESYGSLLVHIIWGRLPPETRKNLARANTKTTWTLDELQTGILIEIRVLESGLLMESIAENSTDATPPMTATSFLPSSSKQRMTSRPSSCTYCQLTSYSSFNCDKLSDQKQRLDFVRKENLCFNCLGRHRASQCKSKSRCKNCRGKHHTTLCNSPAVNERSTKQDTTPATPKDAQPVSSTQTISTETASNTNMTISLQICLSTTTLAC